MRIGILNIIALMAISCHYKSHESKLSAIMKLPSFKIISIDSTIFINSDDLTNKCPIILIYFEPDCEHCQRETTNIITHIKELQRANIYWITNGATDITKRFYNNNRIDTLKNAFLGKDYNYSFYRSYLPPEVPYIAIYNSNQKLVKIYRGEADVNSIITTVKE